MSKNKRVVANNTRYTMTVPGGVNEVIGPGESTLVEGESQQGEVEPKPLKLRGFAAMNRELVREIASKGGRIAHEKGTAHEFTPEEASEAGRKGGRSTQAKRSRTA